MLPRTWWLVLVGMFISGLYSGLYFFSVVAAVLAVLGGIALYWRNRALQQVIYHRKIQYKRGFPGETLQFRIEVENNKLLPVSWLQVTDLIPTAVGPRDEKLLTPTENPERGSLVNLFSLHWFERSSRLYELLLRQRGIYPLGPAKLESGDLFGLFDTQVTHQAVDYLTVFPTPLPVQALQLPALDPFGDRRARRRLYDDPNMPMGVRDYHPEDELRRVHWPATARTGILQAKVYQPVSARVMVICLNINTLQQSWQGSDSPMLERLVSIAAALVERGVTEGYRVGMVSNGHLAHSDQPFRVQPGRSPDQLGRLLETLAAVTPFTKIPFERFLLVEAPRLPYGASLVVVTALLSTSLQETLVRLKTRGHAMTLIALSLQPPQVLPGVQVLHLPYDEEIRG